MIYHGWGGCLGSWRPGKLVHLTDLDHRFLGHTLPCGRCLHGTRPRHMSMVYIIGDHNIGTYEAATWVKAMSS